jgi:hypothetical protein
MPTRSKDRVEDINKDARRRQSSWVADVAETLPGADLPQRRMNWPGLSAVLADDPSLDIREPTEDSVRELRKRLVGDLFVDATNLHVRLRNERIVLEGRVHSAAEMRRVIEIVQGVAGSPFVDNRLRVAVR